MMSGLLRRGGPPPEKHGVRGGFLRRGEDGAWAAVADAPTLTGQWDKGLWSLPAGADPATADRTPVWTVVPRLGKPNRHDMADFALRLNELTPELDKVRRERERKKGAGFFFFSRPRLTTTSLSLSPPRLGPPPHRLPPPPGHARPGGRPL